MEVKPVSVGKFGSLPNSPDALLRITNCELRVGRFDKPYQRGEVLSYHFDVAHIKNPNTRFAIYRTLKWGQSEGFYTLYNKNRVLLRYGPTSTKDDILYKEADLVIKSCGNGNYDY